MTAEDKKLVKECAIQLYVLALEKNNSSTSDEFLVKSSIDKAKKIVDLLNNELS